MTTVLIIGAGPAGLACAMELHRATQDFLVVEKEDVVGGLARTLSFKEGPYEFRTDIGPHRFFSKNQYIYQFIEGLIGEKWMLVRRQTRQFINGRFYDYPINALQAFRNIGPVTAARMGLSYLAAAVQYRLLGKKVRNFEDYIVANFGRALGEFNMLNYTEKIWGIPCREIHPDWARQRIKGLNLLSALKKAVLRKGGPKTLVDEFYYPQYGTGLIYETIAKKINAGKKRVFTSSEPVRIVHQKKRITAVELRINGKKKIVKPAQVVSSMPITQLLEIMHPRPPAPVLEASRKLRWRSQVYLFLTFDRPRLTRDNWVYFPNKEIPFGRIAEMKNFSKDMSPKNKTSLFVEFFVDEGDKVWNMGKDELLEMTMGHLEALGFGKKEEVRHAYVLKRRFVYPLYDVHYQKRLATIKKYLDSIENLQYIGRPGRFLYTNQDHSLELGILAARSIISGEKYDLEQVGSDTEYFEKGELRTRAA